MRIFKNQMFHLFTSICWYHYWDLTLTNKLSIILKFSYISIAISWVWINGKIINSYIFLISQLDKLSYLVVIIIIIYIYIERERKGEY